MAAAAFFNQKVKTLFTRFDTDRNGMIELQDFEAWEARLSQIGQFSKEKSAVLKKNLLEIWENLFLPADTNHDGSVELPELVNYLKSALIDVFKRMTITSSLPLIFEAIDTNNDDAIAADEFAIYFNSLGITDTAFALEVFKAMDTNNDGVLSKKEFADFGTDFFLPGTDPASPSKYFFGKLVD